MFKEPSDEKCQQMVQLQSNFFLAHPGLSPPETPAQQRWCVLLRWSRQTTTSRSTHPWHPPGSYDPSELHFITLPNEWTHFRVIIPALQAILQAMRQCSKEQGERGWHWPGWYLHGILKASLFYSQNLLVSHFISGRSHLSCSGWYGRLFTSVWALFWNSQASMERLAHCRKAVHVSGRLLQSSLW